MAEQKVKKREWVKNAAIIFLAAMLVLTFFSNTIMNHSLPEVAAQYVQSGTINAKIRGSGTIAANESYEVKTEQAREVLSVPVKVGDKVNAGDTLVLFTEAQSDAMKQAQDALNTLLLAYKKALLNNTGSDCAKQNREIEYAQQTLDRARAKRDAAAYSEADLAQARQNVTNAQTAIDNAAAKVKQAQADYKAVKAKQDAADAAVNKASAYRDELGGLKPSTTGDYSSVSSALTALQAAQKDYDAVALAYKAEWDTLKTEAKNKYSETTYSSNPDVYDAALAEQYASIPEKKSIADAYSKIAAAKASVATAQAAYNSALSAYNSQTTSGNEYEYNRRTKLLTDAQTAAAAAAAVTKQYESAKTDADDAKTAAEAAKTAAEARYTELKGQKDAYETAVTNVETAQKAMEDLIFALADQKKTDGKTQAGAALDLADQRRQITEKQKDIAKLKETSDGAVLKSKVSGIVASVSVSAGKSADAGATLMVVEVPDMGYGVELSVTKEQAKKLQVGDQADVTSGGWGETPLTATLAAIKTDPAKPGTNKLLSFKIEGEDITAGSQISLAIGARGGNYDAIVPSSAIRTDNNGSFVLVVVSKSSPLGNRYVAQRVDVQVVASDDTNSAVTGGLTTNDFVITTASKPVEPGKLVRLPDAAQ